MSNSSGVNNSPIFIVGVHRSGTTLLRFMLSSHSRIYIPPESDFIPYFFGSNPYADLTDKQIQKIVNIIFSRYRFVEVWKGEPPSLEYFLSHMPDRKPASFLNVLYRTYASQNGAVRWGDKTPIYASYVSLIHEIFPDAQFIHIIRDPYDSAISLLEKYEKNEFHIDIYFAAQNWVRRITEARSSASFLTANHYYELKYEDLVRTPDIELKRICEFIGECFEPAMLQPQNLASKLIKPDSHFFANVREPINLASIGRGRIGLTNRDKRLIDNVASELMIDLGYVSENMGEMNRSEKIRFEYLRAKYKLLQWGRQFAARTGMLPPI